MSIFHNNTLLGASGAQSTDTYEISRSLRFNNDDSAYLSRSFGSGGNRKTWTWSGWVKLSDYTTQSRVFSANGLDSFGWDTGGTLRFTVSGVGHYTSNAKYRDPTAWYHLVVSCDTTLSDNRIKFYINGDLSFATNANKSQNDNTDINSNVAHYIGSNDSSGFFSDFYLADIHFIDGQALAPTDFGEYDDNNNWNPKAYSGNYGTNGFHLDFSDNSSTTTLGADAAGSNDWTPNNFAVQTAAAHIATGGDPTSSTTNPFGVGQGHSVDCDGTDDQLRFTGPGLVEGDITIECFFRLGTGDGFQRIFSTKEDSYSSEQTIIRRHSNGNFQFYFGNGSPSHEGGSISANTWYHAAIVYDRSAETVSYYVDGSRLSTDSYNGTVRITEMVVGGGYGSENWSGLISNCRVTKQALYSGTTYTVPTSTLTTTSQGADANNVALLCMTTSTITAASGTSGNANEDDSLIDTPTNYEADSGNNGGNYCILNQINKGRGTLSEGGLKWQTGSDSANNTGIIFGTMAVSSGKWYWEVMLTASTGTGSSIGIADTTHEINPNGDGQGLGTTSGSYAYLQDARKYNNGSASSYGDTYAIGDIIGVALDMDNGTLTFYKNGTSQGQAYSGLDGTFFPGLSDFNNQQTWNINFGQRAFVYTPPTNHLSLCTANLDDPSVADGSTAFDIYTYSGTGSEQIFSSIFSFQPDLIWIKKRSGTNIRNHSLHNRISGEERTLQPSDNAGEFDDSQGLKAFGSTGFTIGSEDRVNENSSTYVSWAWYAGGGSAASNTDGTISGGSQVLANQDAGISLVKWSGSGNNKTVGHGLGTTPELIILKDLDTSRAWYVGSKYVGTNWASYLRLDGVQGIQNNSDVFSQGGQPSSTVFGVGAEGNPSGDNLALCFASKEGFSKIGVIHGTGETDGPLVYTGFRPAFAIIKPLYSYSDGDNIIQNTGWYMYDSTRSSINPAGDVLGADRAQNEENNSTDIDFLSNGFKIRNNRAINTSNNALFLAFAEHPFKTARAR